MIALALLGCVATGSIEDLSAEEPTTRIRAIQRLTREPIDLDNGEPLFKCLDDPDKSVRKAAVSGWRGYFKGYDDELYLDYEEKKLDGTATVADKTRSDDWFRRYVDKLAEISQREGADLGSEALISIGHLGNAFTPVAEAFVSPGAGVINHLDPTPSLVSTMEKLAAAPSPSYYRLLQEEDAQAAFVVLDSLSAKSLGPLEPMLRQMLRSKTAAMRFVAVLEYNRLDGKYRKTLLMPLLSDSDEEVRTLVSAANCFVEKDWLQLATASGTTNRARALALRKLGWTKNEAYVPLLRKWQDSPDESIQTAVIDGSWQIYSSGRGPAWLVQLVEKRLDDPSPKVRRGPLKLFSKGSRLLPMHTSRKPLKTRRRTFGRWQHFIGCIFQALPQR